MAHVHGIISPHPGEVHKSQRANWLRAAVLGVDDGIVSTSSIMLGLIAAQASEGIILTTGIAALVAGAISMAAGEYVSVSSQRDAEKADIAIERRALKQNPEGELEELIQIYQARGLTRELAQQVAHQLQQHDAVEAHARDELGFSSRMEAHPLQAAFASMVAFSIGAIIPIIAALTGDSHAAAPIVVVSLIFLAISGWVGAVIGGGNKVVAALRVLIGGGLAMAVTALIGHIVGTHL